MNIMKIEKCSVSNGKGFRIVLWTSGCNHRCEGCHNPEAWNYSKGFKYSQRIEDKIIESMRPCYIDGITLSGGDPLHFNNIDDIFQLIKRIRKEFKETKTIWLYTGEEVNMEFFTNEKYGELFRECDVIVDGPYIQGKRDITLPFRGSTNQRLIDVKQSLVSNKIITLNI